MRWLALAAAAALLLAAGWWVASPWYTLWRMREAAAAGDSRALAAYIDFPAVRASAKRQLRRPLGPFARPAVDLLVSPAALRIALLKPRRGSGAADLELHRAGFGEFRLRRAGGRGDLVFRRHGLSWKLSEVRIARGD